MSNATSTAARTKSPSETDRSRTDLLNGLSLPARLLITGLCLLGLLVSLGALGRHDDSLSVFANALSVGWLAIALVALLLKRTFGFTRSLLLGCVALGILRSAVLVWGVPIGWTVSETIDVRGKSAISQTHMADLSYAAGEVPAHLINDTAKFNFRGDRDDDPEREHLPVVLSARAWVAGQGSLVISSSSPITVAVGPEVTDLRPPIVEWRRPLSVDEEEVVEITTAPTDVSKAALRVRAVGVELYSQPTSGSWMTVCRLLGRLRTVLDWLVMAASLVAAVFAARRRLSRLDRYGMLVVGLAVLSIFFSVGPRFLTWLFQHDALIVLSGGDDWLGYESFARDIRDNSILMLGGKPLGQGKPYYYQVLYPYAVALGHLVLGESVQGIVLAQMAGVAATIALAFRAVSKRPRTAWALVLVLLGTGVAVEWSLQAERLLSENLLLVVYALMIFVISRMARIPSIPSLLMIGILLGIGGVTRSTTWLAVPFLVVLLIRDVNRTRLFPSLAALLVPMVLIASLVPIRNVIVSGEPAWLPTNGSVTLAMGNVPPGRKIQTEPWVELSKRYDPSLVAVAEAVVNAPGEVAAKAVDKAVYVLGFPKSMDADNPWVFWPVLSLWLLAPLALLSRRHSRLEIACLILAVTHVLSLVIVHPHYYYYRLEMPATLPLAIFDAIALGQLLEGLPEPNWAGRQLRRLLPA